MDMDIFSDTRAWAISLILYLIFMAMIWLMPDAFGGSWTGKEWMKYLITILALPCCYIVAKWRLEA